MATAIAPPEQQAKFIETNIGTKTYKLELADTNKARWSGLSNRKSMAHDQGMIFIFPRLVQTEFCMDKMHFPLDFVWVRNNQVIDLIENVPYPGQQAESPVNINRFVIKQKYDKVIELNAGEIKRSKIEIGDQITIPSTNL